MKYQMRSQESTLTQWWFFNILRWSTTIFIITDTIDLLMTSDLFALDLLCPNADKPIFSKVNSFKYVTSAKKCYKQMFERNFAFFTSKTKKKLLWYSLSGPVSTICSLRSETGCCIVLMQKWGERMDPREGGGGTSIYMHIGYVPRKRPPFSAPNFRAGAYYFHKLLKKIKKSVPEHHHSTVFGGFCRSRDHHFQNFFNFNPFIASHGQLSPNAKHSAAPRVSSRPERQPDASWQFQRFAFSSSKRIKLVLEPRIFKLKTAQLARSGAPEFSRSTGSTFRSPGPFFTLPRQ